MYIKKYKCILGKDSLSSEEGTQRCPWTRRTHDLGGANRNVNHCSATGHNERSIMEGYGKWCRDTEKKPKKLSTK